MIKYDMGFSQESGFTPTHGNHTIDVNMSYNDHLLILLSMNPTINPTNHLLDDWNNLVVQLFTLHVCIKCSYINC